MVLYHQPKNHREKLIYQTWKIKQCYWFSWYYIINQKVTEKSLDIKLGKSSNTIGWDFLIHNSRPKIFPEKHFLQNASQELYSKNIFREI